MKRLTHIFVLLVGVLAITACEKEIPFKGDVATRKLVLNGNFSPDSTWNLHLSHSLSIADTGRPREVTTGTIRIKDEAGLTLATLSHDSGGFYTSATEKPEVGKTYLVEAEASGYATVKSSDMAPAPISVSFVDSMSTSFLSEEVLSVNLLLNDPAGEENYYVFDAQALLYDENDVLVDKYSLYNYSLDPNLDQEGIGEENSSFERLYLPDEKLQGQSYPINLLISSGWLKYLVDYPGNGIDRVAVSIRVRTASKALFQYLKSYDKYLNYSFDPTFSQPVQVFSNIENGFGVFAGYSETRFDLDL